MTVETKKASGFVRFIGTVERLGNKLPDPFFMFVYLMIIILALSAILGSMGVSVSYEIADASGNLQLMSVSVQNLITKDYLQSVFRDFVDIYLGFAPLGLVMTMMLAIGFAQDTGLFDAVMKKTLLGAPTWAVTYVLAVVGVCANIASSAGVVFAATVGAALFSSLGRNPMVGAVIGYVSSHGGFDANLIPSGTDVNLSGITERAAATMNIAGPTHPLINYYYMVGATFVTALVVTFVAERILPQTMKYGAVSKDVTTEVTPAEGRGLRFAAVAAVVFVVGMLIACMPQNAFFRAEDGTLIPSSPLTDSIVPLLFIAFVLIGAAYGIGAGTVTSQSDVPKFMGNGLKGSISFFVMSLPAALFIQFFDDSSLATILAVNGANLLRSMQLSGYLLALGVVLLTCFVNLVMSSAAAKWLILAPIFVPMLGMLGLSPAYTQVAYRIGDSITNPIAPINFYLPIVIGVMNMYKRPEDPEIGLGSIISMTLPFSIGLLLVLPIQLLIWTLLNLPLGPGAYIYL